jgi:hypothetical protein
MLLNLKETLKKLGVQSYKSSIGKKIGNNIWFHVDYSELFHSYLNESMKMRSQIDFEYNIIRIDTKNDIIALINSPNFDSEFEPYILQSALFENGILKKITTSGKNPQVYHHKWMFVDKNYQGFNYEEQLQRSITWKNKLGINKNLSSRIGRKDFWDNWLKVNNLPL